MAASNLVIISYSLLNINGFYLTFYVAQIVYHKITSTNIKLGLVIDGQTVLLFQQLEELCQEIYQNSNSKNYYQSEWNIKIPAQNVKKRNKQQRKCKRKQKWINLRKIETDGSCGFWKLLSLTVYNVQFWSVWDNVWETYLLGTKLWFSRSPKE